MFSAYHLMFGVNKMFYFVIPLLYNEHPNDLPSLTDAGVIEEDGKYIIELICRIGKSRQGHGYGEEKYLDHPLFIRFEDKLIKKYKGEKLIDDTFGRYYFNIPDEFYNDIVLLVKFKSPKSTSKKYQMTILSRYTKKAQQSLEKIFTLGKNIPS